MRTGLAFLALALACALMPASALAGQPRGNEFYDPPAPLPGKKHGDVIWSLPLAKKDGLKAQGAGRKLLYRSESVNGDPVAVSGFVMTPKGEAPKGGWPIVSFGHGSVGIPDKCAPSKYPVRRGEYGKESLKPLWTGYLKLGYAVAQTDYEGSGTPGDHPYLIGRSEARGVLDIVRAARKVDNRIGKRVLLAGHSQGGHAILWAAGEAESWTPELKILGSQPFAPIATASLLAAGAEAFTTPGGLAPYAGITMRAFDAILPDLDPATIFTQAALDLYPQTRERCLDELFKQDSFGGISVADMVRDDVESEVFVSLYREHVDVSDFKLPGGVLLMHGTADTTIPIALSDALENDLAEAGTKVTYKKYEGSTHGSIVDDARKAALADARKRLR